MKTPKNLLIRKLILQKENEKCDEKLETDTNVANFEIFDCF